jgi:hypothetical protein
VTEVLFRTITQIAVAVMSALQDSQQPHPGPGVAGADGSVQQTQEHIGTFHDIENVIDVAEKYGLHDSDVRLGNW